MEKLRTLLSQHPQGSIHDSREVELALASCWDNLNGSAEGGMHGYKLKNRMERTVWNPPVLEFDLERHGATVNGSVYGHVQHWSVNLQMGKHLLKAKGRDRLAKKTHH